MSKFLYRFSAGFCMGVAEITPGISGATIAGIFNVYEPFIKVLSLFNPKKLISDFNNFFKNSYFYNPIHLVFVFFIKT